MLPAETEHRESDRHSDEGAEEPPEKCPEQDREKHDRGRYRENVAGDARLNIDANRKLYDVEADEQRRNLLPAVELSHCQQCRKKSCDEGADKWNVVERKGDHAPFDCELKARRPGESPDKEPGEQTHLRSHQHILPDPRRRQGASTQQKAWRLRVFERS